MTRLTPLIALLACNPPPTAEQLDATRGGRIDWFFNDPGARLEQVWSPDAVDVMIDLVDNADQTIEVAVMGFSYEPLAEAFVRAFDRGVRIQMVGDAEHQTNYGYVRFRERHIPMAIGNQPHIMHDKFMVVDDRFVFASTANWSQTDLKQNSNNFVVIDSPAVAADFKAEHDQMFQGVFGHNKVEIDNGRFYQVGDTLVEVWFAPHEDAAGRMVELIDGAKDSVWFTIFAFTKDQVGSAYIRKQEQLAQEGRLVEGDRSVGVWGVIDQSQLHSNGQYHEAFRLLGAEIPIRMDGNDASAQPGDYQAGGGRLHSKTMIIDPDGDDPVVISGSFNWSASATQSNDEYLLVFHGQRVAELYKSYFNYLYDNGRPLGPERIGEGEDPLQPGDITFNEVHWYGSHPLDIDGNDEFIELRNHTDRDVVLDMWQISNPDDFVLGFPPGSVIPANGTFTVVDHILEPYQDGAPQDEHTAFLDGDMVLNAYNDNRQARLYLKDGAMQLSLLDPLAREMDRVGDGGPPFFGGPVGALTETRTVGNPPEDQIYQAEIVRSMIRIDDRGDGADRASWGPSTVDQGSDWVNTAPFLWDADGEPLWGYRETLLVTPGELDPAQQ